MLGEFEIDFGAHNVANLSIVLILIAGLKY